MIDLFYCHKTLSGLLNLTEHLTSHDNEALSAIRKADRYCDERGFALGEMLVEIPPENLGNQVVFAKISNISGGAGTS